MAIVDLLGHPTWTSVSGGDGPTIVLLHGGLSNSDALLDTIGPCLTGHRLAAFDRRGHGRTADSPAPFHYDAMADETIAFLESLGGPAHVVGWSDGGIIGLLVAMRRPDLVGRLVAIGANYHYDGLRPLHIDPTSPIAGVMDTQYAERSPDGAAHFETVLTKTLTMFATEPALTTEDLSTITVPTLVLAGDDDLIELAHTCSLYESIPGAQLAVVPGTSHGLPQEEPEETARIILRFLARELPPVTLMPSRRA